MLTFFFSSFSPDMVSVSANFWLLLLFIGLVWLYFAIKINHATRRLVHVKTGKPMYSLPYLYTTWSLLRSLIFKVSRRQAIIDKMYDIPDIYISWFGSHPRITVTNPDTIAEVMSHKKTDKAMDEITAPHLARVLKDSLVMTSDNTNGLKFRRVLNPAFKYSKLNSLVPSFVELAHELLNVWEEQVEKKKDNVVNVSHYMKNVTFDAIGKTAFGHNFNAITQETEEKLNLEMMFGGIVQPLVILFGPKFVKIRTEYQIKLDAATKASEKLVLDVVNKRRQNRENDEGRDLDLLDHILAADNNNELTNQELLQNIYLFFLAGQETSAGTMVSVMYFLAKHPEIQEKALEEVKDVLKGGDPDKENITRLSYLEAIIKEALRINVPLYSCTWRKATEDMVLQDYFIPKDTYLSVNFLPAHMKEEYWGPDVREFVPERWLAPGAHKLKNFAFSSGPRICIGKKFSMIEMKIILSMIIQRWRWSLEPGYKWEDAMFSITLTPAKPMKVVLERR
eukprot:TRINITY_DN4006_c0_g1_i2.p1 TRINITY_DN4006_c0_g1~~TRINITY_DN4006_c0_g1_i2.p1  ORF type:complete len:508 (+),score=98.07 TRINITY_DN4006_c0_g1_i2:63-1586(+)